MTLSKPTRRSSWRMSLIALASVAAVGTGALTLGSASAQNAASPPPADGAPSMRHGDHKRGMEWVETKLKLTASQSVLFDAAMSKMRPPTELREQMRKSHEQYLTALLDPSFDPRKWIAEDDRLRTEREERMKETHTALLAFWDSLDATQKTQVREFLIKRALHQHRGGRQGGWGDHERGGQESREGGWDGAQPTKQ